MSNGYFESDRIAWLLAHVYNFAPYEPLKYEHTTPDGDVQSHFLANTSNRVKILIQYDETELEFP